MKKIYIYIFTIISVAKPCFWQLCTFSCMHQIRDELNKPTLKAIKKWRGNHRQWECRTSHVAGIMFRVSTLNMCGIKTRLFLCCCLLLLLFVAVIVVVVCPRTIQLNKFMWQLQFTYQWKGITKGRVQAAWK